MKALSILSLIFLLSFSASEKKYSPYYSLGVKSDNLNIVVNQIKAKAKTSGYTMLGEYAPGKQSDLYVLVFTNSQIKAITSKATNQGIIAATYRIGLELKAGKVELSAVNPTYQWIAYLGEDYEDASAALNAEKSRFETFCKQIGNGALVPFGGEVEESDLEEFQYMFGMPYYEDQVDLAKFSSHAEGIKTIEANLKSTSGISHVYTIKDPTNEVVIYGIGLLDKEMGEKHFLSIIGQKHVAALPYELILDGEEAKMLHGRFRFALYWPELTMGTFTKIMSTPGDVEDAMEQLVISK